eukprot:87841_1
MADINKLIMAEDTKQLSQEDIERLSWDLGSVCSIYLRAKKIWCIGQIINVYIDSETNKEWLVVKYNNNKIRKLQRLSHDLQPIAISSIEANVNFAVFRSSTSICFGPKNSNFSINIDGCSHLNRILHGLKYYLSLSNEDDFTRFCKEVYQCILDDYIHVITIHSNQLSEIHEQLITDKQFSECNVNKCAVVQRHYHRRLNRKRNNTNNLRQLQDPQSKFYADIFDAVHHYFFHLFDLGLRIKKKTNEEIEMESHDYADSNNKYKCIDYEFSRTQQIIAQKQNALGLEINEIDNNKFNMQTTVTSAVNINNNENNGDNTFIDLLFEYIIKRKLFQDNVKHRLYEMMSAEQYDTDSIIDDYYDYISIYSTESNIHNTLNNGELSSLIKQFIKNTESSSVSFSVGIIWFYWEYYKDKEDIDLGFSHNVNDYGGYKIKKLFVQQKYDNYKEETLHHISITDYTESVMLKANTYFIKDKVKAMRANYYDKYLHYGISKGNSITINHIISVILYCDFSEYCTAFSATFRAVKPLEPLTLIKKRNQEFWWQSKLFRETVEIYGKFGIKKENETKNRENGPFYSGISAQLIIPQFCIRLCSPTSTSRHAEVAIKFAKRDGIIIQLNNTGFKGAAGLTLFDCSWLSKYAEEDERVFVGGDTPIRIETIKIIQTKKNFELFFHALFILDTMLNGTTMNGMEITTDDVDIVTKLMKVQNTSFDQYIISTWDLFKRNKKQIVVNLDYLDEHFKEIYDLIIVCGVHHQYRMKDRSNLVNVCVLEIFENVTHLIIYTTGYSYGFHRVYAFDLLYFLSTLGDISSIQQITIKAVREYKYGKYQPSWIYLLSSTKWSSIQSAYNEKQLKIHYTKSKNHKGEIEDCFIIETNSYKIV